MYYKEQSDMFTPIFPPSSTHSRASAALHGRPGSKALAAMLLAAFVSALIVVADSVIEIYADGHLLLGWITLWAVGFTAMGLLASTARKTAVSLSRAMSNRHQRRAQKRADAYLMALAHHDPRIMAEVLAAMDRANAAAQAMDHAQALAWVERHPVGTFNAAYQGRRNKFRTTPLAGLPTHMQYFPG